MKKFKKAFEFLDDLWVRVEMYIIEESEDLVTYRCYLDECDDDECAILEVERSILSDILNKNSINLIDLFKYEKINFVKPYTGKNEYKLEGFDEDLFFVILLQVLLNYLYENEKFGEKIEIINLKFFKKHSPDTYKKMLELIEENERMLKEQAN